MCGRGSLSFVIDLYLLREWVGGRGSRGGDRGGPIGEESKDLRHTVCHARVILRSVLPISGKHLQKLQLVPEKENLESSVAFPVQPDFNTSAVRQVSASKQRGNKLKDFEDFHLKAKTRIWP